MLFVSYMRRSAKILILYEEGIIEKVSDERRAYESVDDGRPSWLISRKAKEKNIHAIKG